MSKEFETDQNIRYENKLKYDYVGSNINKYEMNVPIDKTKPLDMTFFNGTTEPNIVYTQDGSSLACFHKKIYVYKLLHNNIKNITTDDNSIVGELVIEHTPSGDSSDKHYMCILLKHAYRATQTNNDVDILLNFKNQDTMVNTNIELNKILPKQDKCIVYKSENANNKNKNTVYIFTTPIEINDKSKEIIQGFVNSTDLFKISHDDNASYDVLPATNISQSGNEEIYIDCNPTGESQEEIDTYNIPINSRMNTQQQETSTMKTATNFAIFTMYSLLLAMVLPVLYKETAVKAAIMAQEVTSAIRMRSIDSMIVVTLLLVVIALFAYGFGKDNYTLILSGSVILYTAIATGTILSIKKDNKEFMSVGDKTIEYKEDDKSYFDINDIGGMFKSLVSFIFSSNVIAPIVSLSAVFLLVLYLVHYADAFFDFWATFGAGESILIMVVVLVQLYLKMRKA